MSKKLGLIKVIEKLTLIGIVEDMVSNMIISEVNKEIKYYVTILYNKQLKGFVKVLRSEKKIENNLHCHLDVIFKEYKNTVSEKTIQQNRNILRKLGLNILKWYNLFIN